MPLERWMNNLFAPAEEYQAESPTAWRWQTVAAYVLISLVLLVPCFWQPRLHGGDLSSHMSNAWMAAMVENGSINGLLRVHQWTNILFEVMMGGLFPLVGAEAAQRLSVSIVVLVFVWGAFQFISVVSRQRTWYMLPCIAMLAYGWVYHMGFFNFYLSLGLCFWTMTLAWTWQPRRVAAAAGIFLLAYLAHALPVVWTLGLLSYVFLARRLSPLGRACLTALYVLVLLAVHAAIAQLMVSRWSPAQFTMAIGVDQLWVFDDKYYLVLMGLLVVWGGLFLGLLRVSGARQVVASVPFQLCVISAAAVSILPGTVLIPGFYQALGYIAERMSLGVAICVCALLGAVRPRFPLRCMLFVVAFVFFGFVYKDERVQNSFEDRMQDVVSHVLPARKAQKSAALPVAVRAGFRDHSQLGGIPGSADVPPPGESTW